MLEPCDTTYEVHVTLAGIDPPIWRAFTVPADIGLGHLHLVIQVTMGWLNSHLHEFRLGRRRFAPPNPYGDDFGDKIEDEANYQLCELLNRPKQNLVYTYDFGDGWEHKVTLAAIRPVRCRAPKVLAGKRACPPEDCGGPGGYYDLLAVLANPDDPEHAERKEWVPAGFDAEVYPISEVIERMAGGVSGLAKNYGVFGDWDEEEGDKNVIQFPKGGP